MGNEKIQKGFFFRSKLDHVKFKGNKYAEFSSFLILLKKCGKKSDSSLRSLKNFTKDSHVKKNYMGILCKMNTYQNYMQFLCKFFCCRSLINLERNSFIKYKMDIFTKDFHAKNISMKILSKMKQRFVLKSVKPTPP